MDVPPLPQFGVDNGTQTILRAVADQTVRMIPPRMWCPSEPFG